MHNSTAPPSETLYGFLAVLEEPTAGMVGGLLLLDRRGRPLEFHCTTPIRPTRADEILCGATLRTMFYCERLGTALLARAKRTPDLLLVNQIDLWPIAEETAAPVVLVRSDSLVDEDTTTSNDRSPALASLDRLPPECCEQARLQLDELEHHIDLAEPFDRIDEAIHETGLLSEHEKPSPAEDGEPHDLAA